MLSIIHTIALAIVGLLLAAEPAAAEVGFTPYCNVGWTVSGALPFLQLQMTTTASRSRTTTSVHEGSSCSASCFQPAPRPGPLHILLPIVRPS